MMRNIRIDKRSVTGGEYLTIYENGRPAGSVSRDVSGEGSRIRIGFCNEELELFFDFDLPLRDWNVTWYTRPGKDSPWNLPPVPERDPRLLRSLEGNQVYLTYEGSCYPVFWEKERDNRLKTLVVGGCENQAGEDSLQTNIIARIRRQEDSGDTQRYEYESRFPLPDKFVAMILSLVMVAPWACKYPNGEWRSQSLQYYKAEITSDIRRNRTYQRIFCSENGKWKEYPKNVMLKNENLEKILRIEEKRRFWEAKVKDREKGDPTISCCRYNHPADPGAESFLLLKQEFCLKERAFLYRVVLIDTSLPRRIRVYDSAARITPDRISHDILAELIPINDGIYGQEYAIRIYKPVEEALLDAILTLPLMPFMDIFLNSRETEILP